MSAARASVPVWLEADAHQVIDEALGDGWEGPAAVRVWELVALGLAAEEAEWRPHSHRGDTGTCGEADLVGDHIDGQCTACWEADVLGHDDDRCADCGEAECFGSCARPEDVVS